MVTVKKATIELFDSFYPLLEYFAIEGMGKGEWFRLFRRRLSTEHEHFGYVLLDGDKAVGFLGAFFSERVIDGTPHSFCNLFCWHVLEEFRKASLLLLRPILHLKNLTITGLTSSKEALMIYERLGFTSLEDTVIIYPFLPTCFGQGDFVYTSSPEEIRSQLVGEDLKIFDDHRFPACGHLLVTTKGVQGTYCYLVFNRVCKKNLHFTQICYVSSHDVFVQAFPTIQRFFYKKNRTIFTLIDKRLTGKHRPKFGFNYSLRYPRLYRSSGLQPEQVDNLYTELILLGRV